MRKNKKSLLKYYIIVLIVIIEIWTIHIFEKFWKSSRNLKKRTKNVKDMEKRIYQCYINVFNFDPKRTVRNFFLKCILRRGLKF